MTITLRFFALGRELVGASELRYVFDHPTVTVSDVVQRLKSEYAVLEQLPSFLVAVNSEYGMNDTALYDGDELAIIPPVSGG